MLPKNLPELLSISARKYPHRIALVFGQKKISYRQLEESSGRIAQGLLKLGIKALDKIAIFLDNCPEFVISYYAILKAGGIVVPINYMFKIEEAKFILHDSQAICIITSRAYLDMAEELRLRVDTLKHIICTAKTSDGTFYFNNISIDEDGLIQKDYSSAATDLAVILYTSGTTGFPKGAMLSHGNLISNAHASSHAIKATKKDTVICILPLFHSFAATVCMNLPLLVGAKIVLMKSVSPFKRVIRSIRKNHVTIFVAVPSIYNIIKNIKLPKLFSSPLIKLFNPVRACISGAAALPEDTFIGFEKKFRIPLLEGYGLTEASPVVTLNPLNKKRKPGSIGISISRDIELKIVDDFSRPIGPEQIGELLVKGPNIMNGYYKQEEATSEAIRDGWLYTGDMAKFDQDGCVYIAGRKKEMVNVRGLNVYPREIEEVLYQNHKVKEAAVIGIPDEHKGEVPKGFVVLKEGETSSEHEISQYLKERLAAYKIPKNIEFRKSLPKNSTGKILKRFLIVFLLFSLLSLNFVNSAFGKENEYKNIIKEVKSGNLDFAFLKLDSYLRQYPDSIHIPMVKFGISEYYYHIKDYPSSIAELASLIKDYPNDENIVFAYALLYKINLEYQEEPELSDKIKEKFFSKSIFLVFSDSKVKSFTSILNNKYKIVEYIDRIEVFKNAELLFEATP